jgi:hypothetical protein
VHDAAGKKVINERNIRLKPFITFHGFSDGARSTAAGSKSLHGLYIWQYSRSPPALPTAPIAAAATTGQEAPARKDAQICWLAAPVPVASLPASFIQQAPSWQEGKVFASYEQL